ncbi:hypothetical protein MHB44_12880 [Lysinibacillus sp. FSL H8-0500]|uniref:hypothetical protein n=1 Tax=Lysinibacillus TaxID=400634 RepID=UPI000AFD0E6F|nr:hypothetical protein [Lysinibacillus macroides]QPR69216.1 hypothetical protein I6G82_06265 [Lysinibacillus macroides]
MKINIILLAFLTLLLVACHDGHKQPNNKQTAIVKKEPFTFTIMSDKQVYTKLYKI